MVQRPRGTRDFLPDEMELRRHVEARLRSVAARYGYREVATPTFEEAELFTLRSGSGITEEMYTFKDKGDREMVLRPELTAPVMRFYTESMQNLPKPLKVFYFGNTFRYERPQAGRYREFWHFGVEMIGPGDAVADAELVALAISCLDELGIKEYKVRIGHLGVLKSFLAHRKFPPMEPLMRLIDKKDLNGLSESLAGKVSDDDISALKTLICTAGPRAEVFEKAKGMGLFESGRPEKPWLERLDEICSLLERFGHAGYQVDLGIARGLDYYTGMVFEIDVESLGAEKQVCGGGRYSLAELFGAKPVETCGFAFGFDRLVISLERQGYAHESQGVDFYIAWLGQETRDKAIEITRTIRRSGKSAVMDLMGRNLAKCMKHADQIGARQVVIIGGNELARGVAVVRDMKSGEQTELKLEEIGK